MHQSFRSILLAAAVLALPTAAGAQPVSPGPQVGAPAPSFTVTTLDGRAVTLDSFRGRVLVLNFWATWCPPCRLETPDMIASYKQLHAPGVAFLGVDATEQAPIIRAFVAAKSLPYPVAIDADRSATHAYDVLGIPTTYVIDANGIVRARFVDVISAPQLASFVADARAGRNGSIDSDVQRKIDALLDPKGFVFGNDRTSVLAGVKAVNAAIDASNQLLGQADPAKGEVTDYLRIQAEQATLQSAAIAALSKVATNDSDRATLARLQGDLASNREDWNGAAAAYTTALAAMPNDQDVLNSLATAYLELGRWQDEIATYERLMDLSADPETSVAIGKAYLKLKQYPDAIAAMQRGVTLALDAYSKKPSTDTTIDVAYTNLYLARAYVAANDPNAAGGAFAQTLKYGELLPPKSGSYARYTEQAQEGIVSLGLDTSKTAVSLAPWTGADLPGSVASTIKYRLVVAGKPGTNVHLRASELASGWIASFCSDKVCSPMQLRLTLPESGVKIVEFQLIQNDNRASSTTRARVEAVGTSASAEVSARAR